MKRKLLALSLMLVPGVAFAQDTTIATILGTFRAILDFLIPLLITLAIVFFFWGLAQFILGAGDPAAQAAGRSKMIWGVIALFVIVSVWGLVAIIQNTIGLREEQAATQEVDAFPTVPNGGGGGGGAGGDGGAGTPPPAPPPTI